jgi:lipopolysaccharide biosynthesis glycosyltransferase
MRTDISVALEIDDASGPQTKVSLFTFIEHNPWFTGEVNLLVSKDSPISNKLFSELEIIYPKIKTVDVFQEARIQKILKRSSLVGKDHTNLTRDMLKLGIFLLEGSVLYLSQNSMFFSSVSFMKDTEGCSVTKLINIDASSLIYLSGSVDKLEVLNEICTSLEKDDLVLSKRKIDSAFSSSLKKIKGFNIFSTEGINSSTSYMDRYFNKLKSSLANLTYLHFETKNFNSPLYTKINQIWLQKARDVFNKLQKPIFSQKKVSEKRRPLIASELSTSSNDSPFTDRLAIFTTLNENYVDHAIVSFESFRLKNPDLKLDFFVMSNTLSSGALERLSKNSITHLKVDLNTTFSIDLNWPYPSECFWLFYGPILLNRLGYNYSLYVDADVQCNEPMKLGWLNSLKLMAGANRGKTVRQFIEAIDDFQKVAEIFDIDVNKATSTVSINSGVLFFNNPAYCSSGFYDKAVSLFNRSKNEGFPRKGDDSLLCLIMAVYPDYEYTVLSFSWNDYKFYISKKENHLKSILIHNFRQKPWNPINKRYEKNRLVRKFVFDWLNIKRKLISDGKL